MKKKLHFSKSEVIAYLEDLVSDGLATQDEEELYQDFKWSQNETLKTNYTYKVVLKKMEKEYEGR